MTVTTHVSMFELEGVELGSLGLKSLISRESTSRSSRVPYVKMGTNPANSAGDPIAVIALLLVPSIVQNWRDFWLCFMHVRTHNMLSACLHVLGLQQNLTIFSQIQGQRR